MTTLTRRLGLIALALGPAPALADTDPAAIIAKRRLSLSSGLTGTAAGLAGLLILKPNSAAGLCRIK